MRLLGHGEIKAKLAFEVTGASQSAIKAVEAKGGTVTLKSITGREAPAADKIKADKTAAKRAAKAAAPRAARRRPSAESGRSGACRGQGRGRRPRKAQEPKSEGEARPKEKPAKKDKSE